MCLHLHLLDHAEPVHVDQLLSVLGVHLIPHIHKPHLHYLELLITLLQEGISLALVFLLNAFNLLLMLQNQSLTL